MGTQADVRILGEQAVEGRLFGGGMALPTSVLGRP